MYDLVKLGDKFAAFTNTYIKQNRVSRMEARESSKICYFLMIYE